MDRVNTIIPFHPSSIGKDIKMAAHYAKFDRVCRFQIKFSEIFKCCRETFIINNQRVKQKIFSWIKKSNKSLYYRTNFWP